MVILRLLVKVQALWRAYAVRAIHFNLLSTVSTFTNMAEWPQVRTDDPTLKVTSAKKGEVDMDNFVPTLPKDMGGDTINQIKAAQDALKADKSLVPAAAGSVGTAACIPAASIKHFNIATFKTKVFLLHSFFQYCICFHSRFDFSARPRRSFVSPAIIQRVPSFMRFTCTTCSFAKNSKTSGEVPKRHTK